MGHEDREVRTAEAWWHDLAPERKVQVFRWLNPDVAAAVDHVPGQQALPIRPGRKGEVTP